MKAIFKGKIWTIPNLLSFLRICMIPWLLWTYLERQNGLATALILLLSGLTDTVDGMIARHFNMVSNLGKALDPLADKLTQISMMACLVWRYPPMLLVFFALCVKEGFVLITSLMAIHRSEEVLPADWHGKVTTTALYVTMIVHLLFPALSQTLSHVLIGLCAGLIILSGVLYGIRNIKVIQRGRIEYEKSIECPDSACADL